MSNGRDCVSRAVLSGEWENGAVECAFLVSVVVSLPSSSTCLFDPPNNRPSTKKTRGGGGRAGEDCRFRPLRRRRRRRRHTRLGFTITSRSCCQTLSIWYGCRLLVVLLFWYFSNDFFFHSFQSSSSQKALMVFSFLALTRRFNIVNENNRSRRLWKLNLTISSSQMDARSIICRDKMKNQVFYYLFPCFCFTFLTFGSCQQIRLGLVKGELLVIKWWIYFFFSLSYVFLFSTDI